MTSYISFVSNLLGSIDIFKQLFNNEEFLFFMNYGNTKDPKILVFEFIRNGLYKTFDEYASEIIENEEMMKILETENLENRDKIKLYLGKATQYYYDNYLKNFEYFKIDLKLLIKIAISSITKLLNLDEIKTGEDIYVALVNSITNIVFTLIMPRIEKFTEHTKNKKDYKNWVEKITTTLKSANDILEYRPLYDEYDNFSSSSTDETTEEENKENKENRKRKREEEKDMNDRDSKRRK